LPRDASGAFSGRAPFGQSNAWSGDTDEQYSSFGEDEYGELYVVAIGGKVYQLVDLNAPRPALDDTTFAAAPSSAVAGDLVVYTLTLYNSGGASNGAVQVSIQLPNALSYLPNSFTASAGIVDQNAAPTLTWQGAIGAGATITLTYQATAKTGFTGATPTVAVITVPEVGVFAREAMLTLRTPGSAIADPDFFLPGTQPETHARRHRRSGELPGLPHDADLQAPGAAA
jgi:uncharacterized repeat protein (TIGR01451 family)